MVNYLDHNVVDIIHVGTLLNLSHYNYLNCDKVNILSLLISPIYEEI